MTPAIRLAKKLKLDFELHNYEHESQCQSYGIEAVEKLGIASNRVFKTLVVSTDKNQLAVAIILVEKSLNLKQIAKILGCKKVSMADPKQVENSTGYILGGVSPLGQKKRLPTLIDDAATTHQSLYVSAGKRGLEMELAPIDLAKVTSATFAPISV